jgi:hypothetical protein
MLAPKLACCLLLFSSTSALLECLQSVPYPNPQKWHHAWPYDTSNGVQLSRTITVKLDPATSSSIAAKSANSEGGDPLISDIVGRYQTLLRAKASAADQFRGNISSMPMLSSVSVAVTTEGPAALHLGPDTNESYTVVVNTAGVATVVAPTAFGLKHGLETLAQLVRTPDGVICGINDATPLTVADQPIWPYRALMIDTGRHYMSLATIRHAIDGMATLKVVS